MRLQVLVSTMNQTDFSLPERMNLQSDAIVINQCDRHDHEVIRFRNHRIQYYSFSERGIGLSRNTGLMRADADICLFGDDDVTYVDGYNDMIIQAFEDNPSADILFFNVASTNPARPLHMSRKSERVRWYSCLRYGAVRIAARTHRLRETNMHFSMLFGGGAKYSAGEDSLFIFEALRKGLKAYACPLTIGVAKQEDSTWFKGYDDAYFFDRGVLYACLSNKLAALFCMQYALCHRKAYSGQMRMGTAFRLMMEGVSEQRGWKG